jgi:HemX protein
MFDAILYLYALGLAFYFSGSYGSSQSVNRAGTWLLFLVWLLQTVYSVSHLYERRTELSFTATELALGGSWFLITGALVLSRFVRTPLLVLGLNMAGFAALALHLLTPSALMLHRPGWEVSDELLFIHITLSLGSYAAFSVSAVWSGMYLYLHRRLKEKQWSPSLTKLPSLEKLERYALRTAALGMPMLFISLSLGAVWLKLMDRSGYLADWKVLGSLMVLAGYSCYLFLSTTRRSPGHRLAVWNLAAYAIVAINITVMNLLTEFHQWIWM